MTLNDRILDFLDGSLPADDEAELLHTLSVSPEKRTLLRNFMEQRALLVRDSKSISVPYAAEQRLWARLDAVLPQVAEPAERVAPVAVRSGFFARALGSAATAIGAFTLVAGLGIGFIAGKNAGNNSHAPAIAASHRESPVSVQNITTVLRGNAQPAKTITKYVTYTSFDRAPLAFPVLLRQLTPGVAAMEDRSERPRITTAEIPATAPIAMAIGGDGKGITPIFHKIRPERSTETSESLLSRFEFRFNESIGRQFPNSVATNISLPLITNSSIGTYFQILPHSNLLWAGAAYGTASVTRKSLFTSTGNPLDPSQEVLSADTAHAQTSYISAIAELRLPAFATADLTFSAGYGLASLGKMMFGEIGLHYDVSQEVGFVCGLRALQFTYDLSGQKQAAIKSGTGALVIPNAVEAASPSFNTELDAGLFFHF